MATVIDFVEPPVDIAGTDIVEPDDDQLAVMLKHEWQNRVAFFHSAWKIYRNGVWGERDKHETNRHIRTFLRTKRHMKVEVNQARVRALASMMEDDVYIPDRDIIAVEDTAKKYINLQNGLYNLETGELETHRPELYLTSQLDFAYDPQADCPTFKRYLKSTLVFPDGQHDEDLALLFQQAIAYSMTARTDLKASFWLVGKPDAGKSTFIAFLRGLMGSLHATIDLNQLGQNRFLLSGIAGKRVVTFTEASENSFLPDALYKTVVGGSDEIYVDVKNKTGFSFRPTAKFWWAMNAAPRIADRSDAIFNRLIIIPFNRTVPKKERILDLEQRLLAEKAGIFNLVMGAYYFLLKERHFHPCEQSMRLRTEYQRENDTEFTFLQENFDYDLNFKAQAQDLYNTYHLWCGNNGFKPKNRNQVAKDWERLSLIRTMSNGKVYWKGLKPKNANLL